MMNLNTKIFSSIYTKKKIHNWRDVEVNVLKVLANLQVWDKTRIPPILLKSNLKGLALLSTEFIWKAQVENKYEIFV